MSKKIVYVLMAVCLVTAVFSAGKEVSAVQTSPWTEGKTWSYKWEISYASVMAMVKDAMEQPEFQSIYQDFTFDYWASGGAVEMLTITYNGVQGGNYNFSYTEGVYSEGTLGMKMTGTIPNMTPTQSVDVVEEIKVKLDGKCSGTLDVIEAEYTDWWSDNKTYYYGVANQTINSEGSMDMTMKMKGSSMGMTVDGSIRMIFTWSLNLAINYSPALPWIPKTTPIDVYKSITATYRGSISGSVKVEVSGMMGYGMQNMDTTISEALNGSEAFYTDLESMSTTVKKPSPEQGASGVGSTILSGKAMPSTYGSYYSQKNLTTIDQETTGEFSATETFYTSLNQSGMSSTAGLSTPFSFGATPSGLSSVTTDPATVNSFLNNREGYYKGLSFPSYGQSLFPSEKKGDDWFWIMLTVACAVSATVIIVVVLLIRMRKRRQYMPSYAPPISGLPIGPQPPYYQPPMPPQQQPLPQPYQQVTPGIPSPRLISCPHCGLKGSVSSSHRGKVRCPGCGSMFEV